MTTPTEREILKEKIIIAKKILQLAQKETAEKVKKLKEEGRIDWEQIEYDDGGHKHSDSVEVFKIELWKLNKIFNETK